MVLETIKQFLLAQPSIKRYWIAFSGGLDSMVLLDAICSLRKELSLDICAIHINHGLSSHASTWQTFCESVCNTYQIPFEIHSVRISKKPGDSVEDLARQVRYNIFAKLINLNDMLLTAHQEDDQAETTLMQLFRGSGLNGLAAMPKVKILGEGLHGRPLLTIARNQIESYAKEKRLTWVTDESNFNQQYTRNFIRHALLYDLKKKFPAITRTIARSALQIAEASHLLDEFTKEMVMQRSQGRPILSLKDWDTLSRAQQKLVLRTWIRDQKYPLPSATKLQSIMDHVINCGRDKVPKEHWGNVEIRRFQDELYLMPALSSHDEHQVFQWPLKQRLTIPNLGSLSAKKVKNDGFKPEITSVEVHFRQGGEMIDMAKRGRCYLKNLLQEWQIPPWERDRIPLIFWNNHCLSVVGYYLNHQFKANKNDFGWAIDLRKI